jgi:hypothetical protein
MLRFQILLVSLCMVALVGYGLCLPVIFATPGPDTVEECEACLPPGVTLDTCFRRNGRDDPQTLTVRDQLRELGAYCHHGVGFEAIYGADGLPIQFYFPRELGENLEHWCGPRRTHDRYVPIGLMPREAITPVQPLVDPGAAEEGEMAALKRQGHLVILWPIDRLRENREDGVAGLFCDPDLVSVLKPGDAITWSIETQSSHEPVRTIDGEGVIEADGRVFLGPPYWPVQVAGLTPIQAETIIHKDLRRRPGRSGLSRYVVIEEETYRVRVRHKIGSPAVLSTH